MSDNEVTLPHKFDGKGNYAQGKSAVRLREIGPVCVFEYSTCLEGPSQMGLDLVSCKLQGTFFLVEAYPDLPD